MRMVSVSRRTVLAVPCLGAVAVTATGARSAQLPATLDAMPAWLELASVPGASWAVLHASSTIASGE
jgi:hypothetical protein